MENLLHLLFIKVIQDNIQLRISGVGNTNNESGFYTPHPPQIEIFPGRGPGFVSLENAKDLAHTSSDPAFELITLAHEYGHFISDKNGERTVRYGEVILDYPITSWPSLNITDKEEIFNEEKNAWKHAECILKEIGFKNWEQYESHKTASLKKYEELLDLSQIS